MNVRPAKVIGIILIVFVLAAVGGVGWMYFSSSLKVEFHARTEDGKANCIVEIPMQETFSSLKSQLASESFVGVRFSEEELTVPGDYVFYTWNVDLHNNTFLKADIIEIQIVPRDGYILQLSDAALHSLDSHTSGTVSATVLASASSENSTEAWVTWYFWGLPFSAKIPLNTK